jgi:hypothetical protein
MLVRLIDDYLFVTTDLSKAREFLEAMLAGILAICMMSARRLY